MREKLAHALVAALVVDAVDDEIVFLGVIGDGEQMKVADEAWRKILADERLVLEIPHGEVERRAPIGSGDLREPRAIFGFGSLANAPQVRKHRKAQRIRIDAAV